MLQCLLLHIETVLQVNLVCFVSYHTFFEFEFWIPL